MTKNISKYSQNTCRIHWSHTDKVIFAAYQDCTVKSLLHSLNIMNVPKEEYPKYCNDQELYWKRLVLAVYDKKSRPYLPKPSNKRRYGVSTDKSKNFVNE